MRKNSRGIRLRKQVGQETVKNNKGLEKKKEDRDKNAIAYEREEKE